MGIVSKIKNKAPIFMLLFFILTSGPVTAQINRLNNLIIDSTDYNFNKTVVFRSGIHLPFGLQPFISGEVKLLKRVTLNIQMGTTIDDGDPPWNVTDPAELADSDKIGFSGFISPELRYFYRPTPRMPKKNTPLFGFSGAYIALKYFASTPSSKINSAPNYTYENVSAWQINIGGQIQWNRHCFAGIYAGKVLSKRPIQNGLVTKIPLLQFGFTVGYVF